MFNHVHAARYVRVIFQLSPQNLERLCDDCCVGHLNDAALIIRVADCGGIEAELVWVHACVYAEWIEPRHMQKPIDTS